MILNISVRTLKQCRNMLAEVYKIEASDNAYDNGNLASIHQAVLATELAIEQIKKRIANAP